MIVTYIRSSSYNNYAYCQMQYFINYVLGHPTQSNKKADTGTMVHKVMEVLAVLKKYKQDNPKARILKCVDDAIGEVKVGSKKLFTDEFVEELADRSFESYAAKTPHHKKPWGKSDRKRVSELAWLMLRHNEGQFDPRNRNVYYPEPHFDIPIEEDWAKFEYEVNGEKVEGQLAIKGTIDLVTLLDDETIEVVDWKTGRRLNWTTGEEKDYDSLWSDPQLLLYFYAMSKMFPDFPNRIMSIFFCQDTEGKIDPKPYSFCFDESDERRFLDMLKKRFEEIKANISPKPLDHTRKNWKCKYLCTFCKQKWPGTDENMCIYIEKHLKEHGMQETISKCTRPGFQIGFYESPG